MPRVRLPRRRRLDPSQVVPDWERFLSVMAPVVEEPTAVQELDDQALLLAAVHVGRLRRAASSQAVARALPGVAFLDFETPWDAALLTSLPALAHAAALRAPWPAEALAALTGEPDRLAALAGPPEPSPPTVSLAQGTGTAHYAVLERALHELGARTRPSLGTLLGGPGSGAELGDSWPGRPPDWAERRWRWDRQRSVLSVDVLLGAPDFDRQLSLLPPLLPLVTAGMAVDTERWLAQVEDGLDGAVAELEEALVLVETGGVVRREPWTSAPWQEVELALRVRTGAPRHDRHAERSLRLELPVDPRAALPADQLVPALLAAGAATLLEAVPDLVPHARAVLERVAQRSTER